MSPIGHATRIVTAAVVAIALAGEVYAKNFTGDDITDLIKVLAELTIIADSCGEYLNYYGKKGLDQEACTEFSKRFFSRWPTREALQNYIRAIVSAIESGQIRCDAGCQAMIQRVEELRITITFYLDYIDYWREN